MTHFNRDEIGLRPARGKVFLERADVDGIALHWPGMKTPLGTPAAVKAALRSWQAQHMAPGGLGDPGGASDIAYQIAVDQDGNTYQLRGLRYRSAANGATDVNEQYGALLLVLAIGEKPTDDLIRVVQKRIARHREIFPASRLIVPHSAVRPEPTGGPGDRVRALITAGAFNPTKETK